MKVLFYIGTLGVGGAEKIITDYMIGLKNHGVETAIIVNYRANSFIEEKIENAGIKIYALDNVMPGNSVGALIWKIKIRLKNYGKEINDILAEEKPDILHINTSAERFRRVTFSKEKIVFMFHSEITRAINISSKKNISVIKTFAEDGMSFFVVNDKALYDVKKYFRTDKVYKLSNAVDYKKITDEVYDRNDFLKTVNIPSDAFVLGHVGRFHKVKNHERIIKIFNELQKKRNAYLVLIGGDDGEKANIEEEIKLAGITDRVRFLGVREDASRIIGVFDALVLPSYSESFSLVLVEAQMLGIRCVASDRVPEEVFCNDNCFRLSLDRSDEEWADLLAGDCRNGNNGEIKQFDLENIVNKLIGYYEEILNG